MSTQYKKGDKIWQEVHYGQGLIKYRCGVVEEIGHRGVKVLFEGMNKAMWRANVKVRLGVPNEQPTALPTPQKEVKPPMKNQDKVSPSVQAVVAQATAVPSTPPLLSLDGIEKAGLDPVQLWIALGEELANRASGDVTKAQKEVEAADRDVKDAAMLLQQAKDSAVAARDKLRRARLAEDGFLKRVKGETEG